MDVSNKTFAFIVMMLALALAGFYLATPVKVLKAVLFYPDGDPYFTEFKRGLLDACKQLNVLVQLRRLPDPDLNYAAYKDALASAANPTGKAQFLLCQAPDAATAQVIGQLPAYAICVRSPVATPPNVLYSVQYDRAALFQALQAADSANGKTHGKALTLVAKGDPVDYLPANGPVVIATTPATILDDLMSYSVAKNVASLFVLNGTLLNPATTQTLSSMFGSTKLYAVGYSDANVTLSADYSAYEQGCLVAALYNKLLQNQPIATFTKQIYTKMILTPDPENPAVDPRAMCVPYC